MPTDTTTHPRARDSRALSWIIPLALAAGGIYVGMRWHASFERWLVPASSRLAPTDPNAPSVSQGTPADAKKELWTCGMHPQVIQDHPGDCPICHMKLTPLAPANAPSHQPTSASASIVTIDPAIVQNMGVRTVPVASGVLSRHLRATATVVEPESARTDINLRVSGWIKTLHADTDGMTVRKGDPLFELSSPDLSLAIEEFIAARHTLDTPAPSDAASAATSLAAAAESRLKTLGLTPEQIEHFATLEHAPLTVTFVAPINAVVIEKASVYNGSSVTAGQLVLRLADRSTMWVDARVPQGSLRHIKQGQHAAIRVDALRHEPLEGVVVFIHPNLDGMTRTALVRVAVPNTDGQLRAGMFATAEFDAPSAAPAPIVPREAIIDTGDTQLVFVSAGKGRFEPRRVTTGDSGDAGMVQILSGITPGESVVASGQFLIDSESRLREAIAKFLSPDSTTPSPSKSPVVSVSPQPAVTSPAAKHDAKAPPELVDRVLAEYLAISEPFGKEEPNTPAASVDALLDAIDALRSAAAGNDAARLIASARDATIAMQSQPIDKQRDLFKPVSAAIITIVDAMPPSNPAVADLYVANCPMAKADWLQRSESLSNPYYAEDMKECGSIVRRVGDNRNPGGTR